MAAVLVVAAGADAGAGELGAQSTAAVGAAAYAVVLSGAVAAVASGVSDAI